MPPIAGAVNVDPTLAPADTLLVRRLSLAEGVSADAMTA